MQSSTKFKEKTEKRIAKVYLALLLTFIQYVNIINKVFAPQINIENDSSFFFEFSVGDIYAFLSLDCLFTGSDLFFLFY